MENMLKPNQHSSSKDLNNNNCPFCNRTLNCDSLQRHQKICQKLKLRNESRKSDIRKSLEIVEFLNKDNETIRLSDLIQRRNTRRQQRKKDHCNFINELQSLQLCREKSESLTLISSMNSLESIFDRSDGSSMKSENERQISKNGNTSLLQINRNGNIDSNSVVKDSRNEQNPKDFDKSSNKSKSIQRNNSYPKEHIHPLSPMDKHLFSQNLHTISENTRKPTHYSSSTELTRETGFAMKSKTSNKLFGSLTHLNLELSKSNEDMIQEQFVGYVETRRYEQQMNKVLQYYSKNYWSNEKEADQKPICDIPKNLSVQRLRLEKWKRSNRNKQLCGVNETNELLYNKSSNQQAKEPMLNENVVEKISSNESRTLYNSRPAMRKPNKSASSLNIHNENDFLQDHLSLENYPIFTEPSNLNGPLSNDKWNLEVIQGNVTKNDPDSFNKRNKNDQLTSGNQVPLHIYLDEPYTNPKLERFKQHQKEAGKCNYKLSDKNDKRIPEETAMIMQSVSIEKKQPDTFNSNFTYFPKVPVGYSENQHSVNKFIIQSPQFNPRPTKKYQEIYSKPVINANKRIHIFGSSPAINCRYVSKDNDYINAWNVKL